MDAKLLGGLSGFSIKFIIELFLSTSRIPKW